QVVTAIDAMKALEILKGDEPIDLLFSDIIMPGGLSGVSLARQAQGLRPEMHILLTSGFVGDSAKLAEHEYPLIDKPYEASALACAIRSLLDQPRPVKRRKPSRATA
ncbi:MAG TPA: hybrid sensor histidine kinase/response regulator, partial [Caulobacteraceae bacterium]|nr:hybrid sensor histidine kinase/response regulator [Caulobacteraceae bacterium]